MGHWRVTRLRCLMMHSAVVRAALLIAPGQARWHMTITGGRRRSLTRWEPLRIIIPRLYRTLLSSVTSSAGPGTTFSYLDAAHDLRLGEIWHKDSGSQTISKFDYEYDVLGQITKWTQQVGASAAQAYDFGNDPVGQLKSAILKDVSGAVL